MLAWVSHPLKIFSNKLSLYLASNVRLRIKEKGSVNVIMFLVRPLLVDRHLTSRVLRWVGFPPKGRCWWRRVIPLA